MKNSQQKILNYQYINNIDFEPHSQHELERLVKKSIIDGKVLEYNKMLSQFIEDCQKQGSKVNHLKSLQKLAEVDRIQLNNNSIKSKGQLVLKIKGSEKLSENQINQLIEAKSKKK